MARRKDPAAQLAWVLHLTALCTGALAASVLLMIFPALERYSAGILLGMLLLAWLVYFLGLKHAQDGPLPARFNGFAAGAAVGMVAFFGINVLQLLAEPLIDLTEYEPIILTVRFACPVLFGAIGALIHKNNNIEEDHNNG